MPMYDTRHKYVSAQRKRLTILAICLGVVLLVVAAGVAFLGTHVVVDSQIYSRNEDVLDLRGQGVTMEHFDALKEKLPDQDIWWDVPFQSSYHHSRSSELTITRLSDEDMKALGYFTELKTVHAEQCEDFGQLQKLMAMRPDLEVSYIVTIDGKEYAKDAETLTVTNLTEEDVALTDYLPQLKSVDGTACTDYAQLAALQQRRPECEVTYNVVLGEKEYALDTKTLDLKNQDISQLLERLAYLPDMQSVRLTDPIGDAQTMEALRTTYPNVAITSELVGVKLSDDGKEVDLSGIKLEKIEDVDKYMPFYPDAERVYLGMPEIDSDTIAAFRETKRQDYKVVWTVMCGSIAVRTDETYFQPIQHHVYYFFDEDTYNLRYCEDMVSIDLGHMSLHECSWLEGMPNLKYLVLSLTFIKDISPITACKEMVWLELFSLPLNDFSPLKELTKLEDLKLTNNAKDVGVIAEMTWLKNLHWEGISYNDTKMLEEALPDTEIVTNGYGWRKLPNYYTHRDLMGMYYMD